MIPSSTRGLITAFTFLSRLPMPHLHDYQPRDAGAALPWFPVVGLAIGMTMAALAWLLLPLLPEVPLAAMLVLMWVLVTGALHLDGLADSADAWLSGAERERALQIMKDPHCGSAAVALVACVLLIKFSTLQVLLSRDALVSIGLVPLLGRALVLILMQTTAYVSPGGIGQHFIDHRNDASVWCAIVLSALVALMALPLWQAITCALATGLVLLGLRKLMIKRLGGCTGDTQGATIEISEAALLLCLAM